MDFSECTSVEKVHAKLLTHLCTEYLDSDKCKENFEKFKMNCNIFLTTPAEKNQSKASEFCEKLRSKGYLDVGQYKDLRTVTNDIDVEIGTLIKMAEQKIEELKERPCIRVVCTARSQGTYIYPRDDHGKDETSNMIHRNWGRENSNNDRIAESFLILVMQDLLKLQTGTSDADLINSFPDLESITFRLVKTYKECFSISGDRGLEYGKELVRFYLQIIKRNFLSGKGDFEKFCDDSLESLFLALAKSARSYQEFVSDCDAYVEEVKIGSIICCHIFNTVVGVDRFWKYYTDGELCLLLEELMNTKDLLSVLQVGKVGISVNISEQEYLTCRQILGNKRECVLPRKESFTEKFQAVSLIGETEQKTREPMEISRGDQRTVKETFDDESSKKVEQMKPTAELAEAGILSQGDSSDPSDGIQKGKMTHIVSHGIYPKVVKRLDKVYGSSILTYSDDKVWICDDLKEFIGIYNNNFTRMKTIHLGFTCYDIATNISWDVIATDCTNDRIVKISSSGRIKELCRTSPLIPYGICVNDKQQIVVGVGVVGGVEVHSKLVVYSSDGSSVLQEIEYDQSGKRLFTGWIRRVRQELSGEYVVAASSRIIFLSTEWNVKWEYDFGLNCDVWALSCDMKNNILIGNREENKIVMIDKDGQLIGTLLTEDDGVDYPLSMDIDAKGRLWIGQDKNVLISTYLE